MRAWLTILWLAVVACGDDGSSSPPHTELPSVTAGVDSAELAALLVEHWEVEAARDPLTATYFGDHSVDAELPPVRRADLLALRARRDALIARFAALDPAALDARDQITYGVVVERLAAEAGLDVCDYERWAISTRGSLVGQLDAVGNDHPLLSDADAVSYLARVTAMPAAIDASADELAAGAAVGEANNRAALLDIIALIRDWAARPPATWSMVYAVRDSSLAAAARDQLERAVIDVIADKLAAAYGRLADRLEADVLPHARAVEGLAGLPDGAACYAAEIRRHTTEPLTAAELHSLGLSEVARIEAAMIALGHELYGVDTLPAIQAQLAADASQSFTSATEIVTWAGETIARARERVTPLFASLPTTPLEVVSYSAGAGQISASYAQSPDGVQPARFYLVTQPPQLQSRWNYEATTFHEAIPGHHLQLSRAAAITDLPLIRRLFTDTAYVEGWGLYAETLAGEIDLYSDGPARIGRLANEALRACRLVIDTGLHDLGWTREEAIAFMEQHTLFAGSYVANEIERYLAGPGQALAYKVGELEILRIRSSLSARAGAAFSLRDFHEAVLSEGSLPLRVLAQHLLGADAPDLTPRLVELARQGH